MSKFIYKVIYLIFLLLTLPVISIVFSQPAYADSCSNIGIPPPTTEPSPIPEGTKQVKITFSNVSDGTYRLRFATVPGIPVHIFTDPATATSGKVTLTIKDDFRNLAGGSHDANLEIDKDPDPKKEDWGPYCENVKYTVGYDENACRMTATPVTPTDAEQIRLDVNFSPSGKHDVLLQTQTLPPDIKKIGEVTVDKNGVGTTIIGPISPPISNITLKLKKEGQAEAKSIGFCEIKNFTVTSSGGATPRPIPSVAPSPPPPPTGPSTPRPAGSPTSSFGDWAKCDGGSADPGIRTAIGCIHTSPVGFIKDFLKFIIGIAGGLAFLMMLLGAFQMLSSAGNPETLQAGRDRLTSAIIGLLFVIFAVLLLQIIGFDILKIPGFGK